MNIDCFQVGIYYFRLKYNTVADVAIDSDDVPFGKHCNSNRSRRISFDHLRASQINAQNTCRSTNKHVHSADTK
jgi:hypothetical protein